MGVFQICIDSIKEDKISRIELPFQCFVNDLTFDTDGVAKLTYSKSEDTKWVISRDPEKVS